MSFRRRFLSIAVLFLGGLLSACAATPAQQKPDEAYVKEAWAYFKKKCETEAGEKIYKTFTGVKSVLVVKPLPPATEKDLFDQFWYGDPYSNATPHEKRGTSSALKLASQTLPVSLGKFGLGFNFVESVVGTKIESEKSFIRYSYPKGSSKPVEKITKIASSRFAISWEDFSTPEDRKFWVAASRLKVIDRDDGSVIAERIGFLIEPGFGSTSGGRRPWLAARGLGKNGNSCPSVHDYSDRWFLLKVLNPAKEDRDDKQ